MISQNKKEKFIELRSQNISYSRIAKELEVSKQTLINWSKELSIELQNAIAIQKDALIEKLQINKVQRIATFANLQKKIFTELETRNFSELSSKELCEVFLKASKALKEELEPIEFIATDSALTLDLTKTTKYYQ